MNANTNVGPMSASNSKATRLRWLAVVGYAVAMAWVEAAVVYYLRLLLGYMDPYRPSPLPKWPELAKAEVVREAATLVMLVAVGWLAGRTWRTRLGYALAAFGVWDIFYYVFLKVLTGWPNSLLDWDILFLIPLPWWGPVLAPVLIAVLMVIGGTLVTQCVTDDRPLRLRVSLWAVSLLGGCGALYVFMADAIRVWPQGLEGIRNVLPVSFQWPLFLGALLLMAAPLLEVSRQLWRGRTAPTPAPADD
jgi:hypothetical protein